MTVYNISINRKFFEPIRNGQITLLIFDKQNIHGNKPGDSIIASVGNYDVEAKIINTYVKAFSDITEEEANKAGFLTKDFLKDELINSFKINPIFSFAKGNLIDDFLFFLVEISSSNEENFIENKVNLYNKEYKKNFYNPQDWRGFYDEKV